jgi:hypothetical protein
METELEQEGNDNAWRTADMRIRKTQVLFSCCLIRFFCFKCCLICNPLSIFSPYSRNGTRSRTSTNIIKQNSSTIPY